jgi:hypothetical protein
MKVKILTLVISLLLCTTLAVPADVGNVKVVTYKALKNGQKTQAGNFTRAQIDKVYPLKSREVQLSVVVGYARIKSDLTVSYMEVTKVVTEYQADRKIITQERTTDLYLDGDVDLSSRKEVVEGLDNRVIYTSDLPNFSKSDEDKFYNDILTIFAASDVVI